MLISGMPKQGMMMGARLMNARKRKERLAHRDFRNKRGDQQAVDAQQTKTKTKPKAR